MAVWKKVIVSGSTANLAALQVDNLTSGQVVIGGGATNLTTTAINGTGNIVATTGASGLAHSGSFTGSFTGNLTGTSSWATNATNAGTATQVANSLTQGTGVTAFTYNGSSAQTVAVSGASALSTNAVTKWTGTAFANSSLTDNGTTITGASSLQLTGINTSLTGSFSGSFTGNINATITNAQTASVVAVTHTTTGTTYYPTFVTAAGTGQQLLADTASNAFTFNATTNTLTTTASYALYALTSSLAERVANSLTAGAGLTGTTFNGSAASTFDVGAGALITVQADAVMVTTSSLTTNQIPKYSANALAGSNISDTGTQVQIAAGASSGLSVAAGGVTVTGNSTFNNNVTIAGNLNVAGTASFTNTDSLFVADKFIALNSGSTTVSDSGLIVITSTGAAGAMSGSAFYLEATTDASPNYGRWAVAANVHATASSATADEYMVSVKLSTNTPSNATPPTWGGATQGVGNMWIETDTGDIYIYA